MRKIIHIIFILCICIPSFARMISIPDNSYNNRHKYGLKGPVYKLTIIDGYKREYIFNDDKLGSLTELLFYNPVDSRIPISVTTWNYNEKMLVTNKIEKSYSVGQYSSSLYAHHEEKYEYNEYDLLSRYLRINDYGKYKESAYIHLFTYDSLKKLVHYINYTNKHLDDREILSTKHTFSENDYLYQSSEMEKETEIDFFYDDSLRLIKEEQSRHNYFGLEGTTERWYGGVIGSTTILYRYDKKRKIEEEYITSERNKLQYFDDNENMIKEIFTHLGWPDRNYTLSKKYDAENNCIEEIYEYKNHTSKTYYKYDYDEYGNYTKRIKYNSKGERVDSVLRKIEYYTQHIIPGNYQLYLPGCNCECMLNLKADSSYFFYYSDDTQRNKTSGTWSLKPGFVKLTPHVIPDTVVIRDIDELKKKHGEEYEIEINEYFSAIPNLDVTLYQDGYKILMKTDSLGIISYKGNLADSLSFSIKDRIFTITPQRKDGITKTRISIATHNKDLIYNILLSDKIFNWDGMLYTKIPDWKDGKIRMRHFRMKKSSIQ